MLFCELMSLDNGTIDPTPVQPESVDNRPEGDVLLRVDGVYKFFGGVTAVRNANLVLRRGQVTSLIGPNGAGKTTLFNAVTGTIPASRGRVVYHDGRDGGVDIQAKRPDKIARLGIARTFQNIRLFSSLSVLDNVRLGATGQQGERLSRAHALL